ncbi:MAG: heme ABC exporter ATP-binding protein CcmA [Acidobacteriaceae bacterium]|nr:heme ABC exporter ATP-binding protein CcmA [Acidobacteriaceae bacterium]
MPNALDVGAVWKYYGDFPALRDFSLTAEKGSCWALLGRNGAGKTTLLRIIAGLSPFQRGSVQVFGNAPRTEAARSRIGFLGHGIGVYEDLSAQGNLTFFGRIRGIAKPDHVAKAWIERVGLARVAAIPVRQFSRGMRQRLALARAFVHSPQLLLLDEPFTSLDDRAIGTLSELLTDARDSGATIVLSTHQLREALVLASHVALIENGVLRYSGERTQEMLDDTSLLYRTYTKLGTA